MDHIHNHGPTMAKVGQKVQLNVGRTTVSLVIQLFYRQNRYYCILTVLLHILFVNNEQDLSF